MKPGRLYIPSDGIVAHYDIYDAERDLELEIVTQTKREMTTTFYGSDGCGCVDVVLCLSLLRASSRFFEDDHALVLTQDGKVAYISNFDAKRFRMLKEK